MPKMTGGQALVQSLKRESVETLFGIPGIQLDWVYDALHAERESIRVVHCRHEQATAYMADGFARTTGQVGAFLVVPGPGVLNTAAALSTAFACNSPVLCITGQIQSDLIGVNRGILHEIDDQLGMLRHVAEQLGAPVVMTSTGRGALSEAHPLAMIQFALPDLLPKADAVLAVGTRMVSFANQPIVVGADRPVVRIDADPAQLNRTSPSTLPIAADAKLALAELAQRLRHPNP